MAKFKIFPQHADFTYPFGEFVEPWLGKHSDRYAVFNELGDNEDILRIDGKKLVYDHDVLVSGTITSMTLSTSEGVKYCTLSKLKLDAEDLPMYSSYWAYQVANEVADLGSDVMKGSSGADVFRGYRGNDRISGMGGEDVLIGGRGSDILSGGGAADEFYFFVGDGRDRITDFTPGVDGLHIDSAWTVEKANGGRDTLIEYEGGSVLLEDVRRGELQVGDIV